MAISKTDMHKEYERYAALCLNMVAVTQDPESRAIQRKMAAEWMKVADAIGHPSEHQQTQMR
jgi:hypothetical protein